MKYIFSLLLIFLPLVGLTSCQDNAGEEDNSEFTVDWEAKNSTYFAERMAEAQAAVAQARSEYGDDWESHCTWRIFRSYLKSSGGKTTDSICAQVIDAGTGSGYPLYTDSVKVNYIGRLIPTASYAEGKMFDHTGLYETESSVFSSDFCIPTALAVSGTIEGFTTALMHMRIGDRWKIYIPQELAYSSSAQSSIPAYSTLVFDLQLKAFYRKGENASN